MHPRPRLGRGTSPLSRLLVPIAALASLTLVAACGAGAPSSGPSGIKPADDDIVVAGVHDGSFEGMDVGFNARIARFNREGGLDGRNIRLLKVEKDGRNLATNLSIVQGYALKEKVFAVTPAASSSFNPSSTELLAKQNIPLIGWAITPAMCAENSFPLLGCQASSKYQSLHLIDQLAQTLGKDIEDVRFGVIGIDGAGGKGGVKSISGVAKVGGAEVVYADAPIPHGGALDYSPYVQAVMEADPDALFLLPDFSTGVALTDALRQGGYAGAIWNPTGYRPDVLASQPELAQAMHGSYVVSQFPPSEETSEAVDKVAEDLEANGSEPHLSLGVSIGWWSAEQFIQELEATAEAGEVTPQNFIKTISSGFEVQGIGGGVSVKFPKGQTQPGGCSGLLSAHRDGTFEVEVPYQCDAFAAVKVG